jgi:bifunctional UDP-N-acetylglucosamine pyrophosphorylase/glucosamine-1-phosphate N-acetyltransferase
MANTAPRAAIILAAGRGERMKSALPKVLHKIAGKRMIDWMVDLAAAAGAARTVVVISEIPEIRAHLSKRLGPENFAVQEQALGTAHAALQAKAALAGFAGDAVVLLNDTPLIRPETLERLFAARARADLVLLGFEARDPFGYGRIVLSGAGVAARIVEEKEASAEEKKIGLCNSGVMVAPAAWLFDLLGQVKNNNAKGEYYITDIVAMANAAGKTVGVVTAPEAELMGANSRAELAEVEAAFQARARAAAMAGGVTLLDPNTVWFSHDTQLAADVTVEPNVFFGPGVRVESGAVIHAFCHLEGAQIGAGAHVGPFARLRPGANLGSDVKIGNFVEVKNAAIGAGAKASHLSYIGDAEVGAGANLGAGTITCNYDGFDKFKTVIGAGAFIGADSALVAPVKIGDGAFVGTGSVITKDVAPNALAVARGRQSEIIGWADTFRARKLATRAAKGANE